MTGQEVKITSRKARQVPSRKRNNFVMGIMKKCFRVQSRSGITRPARFDPSQCAAESCAMWLRPARLLTFYCNYRNTLPGAGPRIEMAGMSELHTREKEGNCHFSGRRNFIGKLAVVPLLGSMGVSSKAGNLGTVAPGESLQQVKALLVSATTLAGHKSLEHAEEELIGLYGGIQRILLVNFASLPPDRDAYAARMQRDFRRINEGFQVDSLHTSSISDAARMVKDAEAVYVSGGNTFLLLRELYDRQVVALLRDRILGGMPYAGSSAGSNLAGINIGTTNDFPLVDIPTRKALGILPGTFNPHHPDPEKKEFDSRQYKIGQYARYHPMDPVVGVNNAGMISIRGDELTLRGAGGFATVQVGGMSEQIADHQSGNISKAINRLMKGGST